MRTRLFPLIVLAAASLAGTGCMEAPGKPHPGSEAPRPEQILDVKTLYKQNCAACHGEGGQNGAAIALANPVYLATAGIANIQRITSEGVPGSLMPAFSRKNGGSLTERQISVLTQGMADGWAHPETLAGQIPPPYAASGLGDAGRGQLAFANFCARCHGADGAGNPKNATNSKNASGSSSTPANGPPGSIVDPAYLALISNQGIRSFIISGRPEQGMPDWRSNSQDAKARAMTDQEITDIVAWIASHRTAAPGQPYPQHP
jgi:cytochrome c oxidase cbb3-type subunit 3/ubiquinol-cytochrome c reductase cytochrome c subunit